MSLELLAKATARVAARFGEHVPTPYSPHSATYLLERLIELDWPAHADPNHPLTPATLRLSWAWWRYQLDRPDAEAHLVPTLVTLARLHPPPRLVAPYLHALRVDHASELALLLKLHDALLQPPAEALPEAVHHQLTDALITRFRGADARRALLMLPPELEHLSARAARLDTWLLRHTPAR